MGKPGPLGPGAFAKGDCPRLVVISREIRHLLDRVVLRGPSDFRFPPASLCGEYNKRNPAERNPRMTFMQESSALILVWFAFYSMIIRPGRVAERQRRAMVKSLLPGEFVMLQHGMRGVVRDIDAAARYIEVEISDGLVCSVDSSAIMSRLPRPTPAAETPVAETPVETLAGTELRADAPQGDGRGGVSQKDISTPASSSAS